jgi:hypothetical protein
VHLTFYLLSKVISTPHGGHKLLHLQVNRNRQLWNAFQTNEVANFGRRSGWADEVLVGRGGGKILERRNLVGWHSMGTAALASQYFCNLKTALSVSLTKNFAKHGEQDGAATETLRSTNTTV